MSQRTLFLIENQVFGRTIMHCFIYLQKQIRGYNANAVIDMFYLFFDALYLYIAVGVISFLA